MTSRTYPTNEEPVIEAPRNVQRWRAADFLCALERAIPFASDDDTRPHLSAILVLGDRNGVRCVATNGHVLGVFDATIARVEANGAFEALVPREHAMLLAKWVKAQIRLLGKHIECEITMELTAGAVIAQSAGGTFSVPRLTDTSFPPYEQVIPAYADADADAQGEGPIGISAEYLALVGLAFKGGRHGVKVRRQGALDPIVFTAEVLEPAMQATMIVMPMRI